MGSVVKDRVGRIGLIAGDSRKGEIKHRVMSTHKIYREMCRGGNRTQQQEGLMMEGLLRRRGRRTSIHKTQDCNSPVLSWHSHEKIRFLSNMCSQTTKETVTFDPKLCGYTSILWWSEKIF